MNDEFVSAVEEIDISLTPMQQELFTKYEKLLVEWNSYINLIAPRDSDNLYTRHFLDSLTVSEVVALRDGMALLDIGSGAGLPGIPLAIVFPQVKVTLLEVIEKKVQFLREATKELGFSNVLVIHGRAEEYGQNMQYRETYDVVVSRAVASLPTLVEYMLPFLKLGGMAVAIKGEKAEQELKSAERAIHQLGGVVENVQRSTITASTLIVIKKANRTHKKYPRRVGVPKQDPLR